MGYTRFTTAHIEIEPLYYFFLSSKAGGLLDNVFSNIYFIQVIILSHFLFLLDV